MPPALPPPTLVLAAALAAATLPARAGDTDITRQLAHWSAEAGRPGDVARGEAFFGRRNDAGASCAGCHGMPPTGPGRHAATGKRLDPLAPAVHPTAFTERARTDKWFRRNCRDVLDRECSPAEKADVLAYLAGLRPTGAGSATGGPR
ncbi:DUF1924 domain-containing protein [Piscinibacter sakaiensis]|uniref:Ubiquinol--cytochrome c reductase, cytochrome B subunit n=1 Tax=Piscinibacter sakaiensis TaxID=1547922 RepID=A0A0K8P9B4_PISS1|nr:DUF1924 domain-containing protein [Piscinibacter sakaiensis]GAP38775.1 ubiquinol--cytochrome c reductase, cytochrome B subunit [Piscinibacter sakaiensis]